MDTAQDRDPLDVVFQVQRDVIALKLLFVLVVVIAFTLAMIWSPATDSSPNKPIPPVTTIEDPVD